MNPQLILQILIMIPSLVAAIESILPVSGQGPQKLDVVVTAITPLIPAEEFPNFAETVLPKIKSYIAVLVAMYKVVGLFKSGSA